MKKYDLEERTAKCAEDIIELCKKAPKNIELAQECRTLWKEAQELTLIFSKIAKSSS